MHCLLYGITGYEHAKLVSEVIVAVAQTKRFPVAFDDREKSLILKLGSLQNTL